jgi:hypothetical protein
MLDNSAAEGPGDNSEPEDAVSEPDSDGYDSEEEFTLQDLIDDHMVGNELHQIVKPRGTGGRTFNICDRMGLSKDREWYNDILVRKLTAYMLSKLVAFIKLAWIGFCSFMDR